jgi:hypothetical protein
MRALSTRHLSGLSWGGTVKNAVQRLTGADRLGGGGLQPLCSLLRGQRSSLFGVEHVVHMVSVDWPIGGADAGFDPIAKRSGLPGAATGATSANPCALSMWWPT